MTCRCHTDNWAILVFNERLIRFAFRVGVAFAFGVAFTFGVAFRISFIYIKFGLAFHVWCLIIAGVLCALVIA